VLSCISGVLGVQGVSGIHCALLFAIFCNLIPEAVCAIINKTISPHDVLSGYLMPAFEEIPPQNASTNRKFTEAQVPRTCVQSWKELCPNPYVLPPGKVQKAPVRHQH